jgi:hypothetical protein
MLKEDISLALECAASLPDEAYCRRGFSPDEAYQGLAAWERKKPPSKGALRNSTKLSSDTSKSNPAILDAKQLATNYHLLNFRCPFINLRDLRITHHSFNVIFFNIAIATMNLNSFGCDLLCDL